MIPIRPKPKRFHHDFETFSLADVTKCGSSRYARDPSTEVLMLAYAFDDDDVQQWVPAEGELMPAEVEDAVLDDDVFKFAWNKPFEWNIWKFVLGLETPHAAWRDPMVLALSLSFPGKLEKAGPIIGLDERYLKKSGKTLINWFSKLRPATKTKPERRVYFHEQPEKWEEYKEYNRYDVLAERKIYKLLRKFDLPEDEWDLWVLDQEINDRGIPVNRRMAENAVEVRDAVIADRLAEMADITGLDNPNAPQQLLPWLQDRGYPFADLKKGHVRRGLQALDDQVTSGSAHPAEIQDEFRVLELRREVSRAAPAKFTALGNHLDEDDRLRNTIQFAAAGRTWRWGGRAYQVHNLAKPEPYLEDLEWETTPLGFERVVGGAQIRAANAVEVMPAEILEYFYQYPMDVLAAATRPVIQAPPGYVFIDADLNAIENRVLGWIAADPRILRVFAEDRDPYVDFATYLYNSPYETLYHEYKVEKDKKKRTTAKPGVLGCGYMLSAGKQYEDKQSGEIEATGLLGYAWNMGVRLTPEEAELSVSVWRKTFKEAVKFWYALQDAAFECMRTRKPTSVRHIGFDYQKPFLRMILPKGRCLYYFMPKMMDWLMPWGDYKMSLTYEQLEKHQWTRVSTHPGKLTENGDQAIARDVLAHGMKLAEQNGIPVVLHVHDQIVGLVREEEAEEKLRVLIQCMSEVPSWAPGLPLAVAGHISKWFVKD